VRITAGRSRAAGRFYRIAFHCIDLWGYAIMTQLGFSGLAETLVIVWVMALVLAVGELTVVKRQNRLPVHPVLFFASRYVRVGCMFTIFGIAARANDHGLITYGLFIFTVLMAALAVLAASVFPVRAKT
jgi:hypothetical protein